jgi:hypothetical protein
VKVTRWFPGVLQAIVEEVKSKSCVSRTTTAGSPTSVKEILAKEATKTLETKRNIQISATKEKSLDEIKREMGIPVESSDSTQAPTTADSGAVPGATPPATTTRRRVRQKMRSTPVTGGSLFDDIKPSTPEEPAADAGGRPFTDSFLGQSAELVVNGEVFKIRVMPQTVQRIKSGYSGELLDDAGVKFSQKDVPIEHRLEGFVRTSGLGLRTIAEDISETTSNHSAKDSEQGGGW